MASRTRKFTRVRADDSRVIGLLAIAPPLALRGLTCHSAAAVR